MRAKPIHVQIREAREAARFTQEDLAKLCEMPRQSSISRIESGRTGLTVETVQRIADALGATFTISGKRKRT